MLEHGGRLQQAARHYGRPLEQWLDLSTGITPFAWPLIAIPERAWHRLPEDEDGLDQVAAAYYQAPRVLPVAGSQAAIQLLPRLRAACRVGIIAPGYQEHARAWHQAGHQVTTASAEALLTRVDEFDVLVLIHPNNPGGEHFDPATLLATHRRLADRGGWLVIDEAFMDPTPSLSLAGYTARAGLVVLRSVGKFFGLAGARAGFLCAEPGLLAEAREQLGPWSLSGPTRHIVAAALADTDWQALARIKLQVAAQQLQDLLSRHGLASEGCSLFRWCRLADAEALHQALARQGILTRLFSEPASLRFGLPADAAAMQRLDLALGQALRELADEG
ncbi:threonine-phosphate decarboxylase CobD [Frateuria aurantia]